MGNYRKTSFVRDYNEETQKMEIKHIVIFKEGEAPIIKKYEGPSSLEEIANSLFKDHGYTSFNGGFEKAFKDGLLEIIDRSNQKKMSELQAEILRDQIVAQGFETKINEEVVEDNTLEESNKEVSNEEPKRIDIPEEYRELAEYFRILQNRYFNLCVKDMQEYASRNKMAGILEDARRRVAEGTMAQKSFDELHDTYVASFDKYKDYDFDDLPNEYRELYFYLIAELKIKDTLDRIAFLSSKNVMVNALEIARRRVAEGMMSQESFDELHDKYRAYLAEEIKKSYQNKSNSKSLRKERTNEENSSRLERVEANPSLNNRTSSGAVESHISDENRQTSDFQRREAVEFDGTLDESSNLNRETVVPPVVEEHTSSNPQGREVVELDGTSTEAKEESSDLNRETVVPPVVEEHTSSNPQEREVVELDGTSTEAKEESLNLNRETVVPPVVEEHTFSNPQGREVVELDGTSTEAKKESSDLNREAVVPPVSEDIPSLVDDDTVDTEFLDSFVEDTEPKLSFNDTPEGPANDNPKKTKKPSFFARLVRREKPVQVVGSIDTPAYDEEDVVVVDPDDDSKDPKKVTIKKSKKFSKWLKRIGAGILTFIAGALAVLGVQEARENNNKTEHNQNATLNSNKMDNYLNAFYLNNNVPDTTRTFLARKEVRDFLSQYKNEAQFNEVVSALCYGYEANILMAGDGNFRLDSDGNNYLRSFTNDFLCAKVVVNNYTPEQMRSVFGDSRVTYEQVMDGFQSYCNTVSVYGTTAVKSLPFKYLTNGDVNTTYVMNNFFSKLINVNINRRNGTLTNKQTDAFIIEADKIFARGDQSLRLSEGAKTVLASMVDAYCYMQANFANGEALYLHESDGLSQAGINLLSTEETDLVGNKAYERYSLYGVIDHLYYNGPVSERCRTEKELLQTNLNEMYTLGSKDKSDINQDLATVLYQNGLTSYGNEVLKGNVTSELLDSIESINPALSTEVEKYEERMASINSQEYVDFSTTTIGVDTLLGINGLRQIKDEAIINLLNSHISNAFNSSYEVVSGKKYADIQNYNNYSHSTSSGENKKPSNQTTTTTTTTVEVNKEDLTPEEQQQVNAQITQQQQEEQHQHQEQLQQAQEVAQDIVDGVQNGTITTNEEAQALGDTVGMTVEPGIVETIQQLHENPELTQQIEDELARKTEEERKAAEERARREAEEEERRRQEEEALINGLGTIENDNSNNSNNPPVPSEDPGLDDSNGSGEFYDPQMDPDRIDVEAGEEPYIGSNNTKEQLTNLRALASIIDVEDLGMDKVETNDGPVKTYTKA